MENKRTGLEDILSVIELMKEDSIIEDTPENSDSTYEVKKRLVEEIHQLEESIMEKLIKVIEMKWHV